MEETTINPETKIESEQEQQARLQEQQERMQRCTERLAKLLEEERCTLHVAMLVTPQGNLPQVRVVPL